jgi:hypothetical protein
MYGQRTPIMLMLQIIQNCGSKMVKMRQVQRRGCRRTETTFQSARRRRSNRRRNHAAGQEVKEGK